LHAVPSYGDNGRIAAGGPSSLSDSGFLLTA
jgi:hypothetical protein